MLLTACLVGCEDGGPPPRTPEAPASYGPGPGGAFGQGYSAQHGASYQPAYGWPPPGQPMPEPAHERRRLDLSLDVPPATATAVTDWLDTRDPFASVPATERRIDAAAGGAAAAAAPATSTARQLPPTHLLVALSVDKVGNHGARANAARKLLAGRGAVKRSDNLWELPSDGPGKGADTLRAELGKLLCYDDRAALFFAEGGKMVKLETAGEQACGEGAK